MRVLIVDDDRDTLELCRLVLESEGHEALCFTVPREALRFALTGQPDAAVLDRIMPRTDGLQLLAALRSQEETRDLPIILLSGLARTEDELEGWEAGADLYVRKPFSPVGLVDALAQLVGMTSSERKAQREATSRRVGKLQERLTYVSGERRLRSGFERLTPSERRVATLVTEGLDVKQACAVLGMAEGTFWSHKRAIRRKLAVPRGEALEAFLRQHFRVIDGDSSTS